MVFPRPQQMPGLAPRVAGKQRAFAAWDVLQRQTWLQLQELPNIGPAMAGDLVRLGVRSVDDLSRRDPHRLYDDLSGLDGVRHDPCVLDTFAAAIHCARTGESVPWWQFSRKRKSSDQGAGIAVDAESGQAQESVPLFSTEQVRS